MNCSKDRISPIRLEWITGHELWPNKVNTFSYSSSEYSYLECEFDSQVAEQVKREIFESGPLYEYQPVKVYVGDTLIRTMYFEPGYFEFGSPDTDSLKEYVGKLELHDLHEQLAKGVVTYRPTQIPTAEVYKRIFRKRKTSTPEYETISGLQYDESVIPNTEKTGPFETALNNIKDGGADEFLFQEDLYDISWQELAGGNPVKDFLQTENEQTSINFEGTPLKAIEYMNNKIGTGSDITPEGELYIGSYPMDPPPNEYTASEESGRADLHIKSGGIQRPVNGYDMVIVEGPPPETTSVEKFNQKTDVYTALDDYRVEAVAQIELETGGKVARYDAHNTDVAELENVASNKLLQHLQEQKVESEIVISGRTSSTTPGDIRLGDVVVIPYRENPCTNEQTASGRFVVTRVEHRYSGNWEIALSLKEVRDIDITTHMRVIDVKQDQSYDYEELYGYTPGA